MRQQLVVEAQNRSGKFENRFTFGGEKKTPALVDENGFSGQFLKALELQCDRRLRSAQSPRGLRDASSLDYRNQRAKHPYVQADQVH
ncbi:hypothetical protein CQ13_30990 [Bradyrhizobium retamae]|uniref:Uncharacterized protein n=1 Tax=Bradyrhizobium retamae TaxID=1300035 RepID=A0A0R3MLZ2_9BRAD|nr:hypothetical protein CQ13_30990 [Bradyrhizobium retamae]